MEEQTNTTPDDGSSSQCLYFTQSFHWKNLHPNNCKLNWMCFYFGIGRCIVLAHLVILLFFSVFKTWVADFSFFFSLESGKDCGSHRATTNNWCEQN